MNEFEDFYGEPELDRAIQTAIAEAKSDLGTAALNPEGKNEVCSHDVFHRTRMILDIPVSSVTMEDRRTVHALISEQL